MKKHKLWNAVCFCSLFAVVLVSKAGCSLRSSSLNWSPGRSELSYLAPIGSEKISAPYFKQCFFRGGGGITPQTESNTTPPSPKTEIRNILFYILNVWLRIYCSGLRGCDTREKEIVIWPCWCFHGRYYFYSPKINLMFLNERKRNANTYLISNFDSLEAAPSNLPP